MLQIYRIEHRETKYGPYQTATPFTQALARIAGSDHMLRAPEDDGLMLGLMPRSYVFGCVDISTLKRWFLFGGTVKENELIIQILKKNGFRLAESLVDECDYKIGISKKQVAFDASKSYRAGLTDYHELDMLLESAPLVFSIFPQYVKMREVLEAQAGVELQ